MADIFNGLPTETIYNSWYRCCRYLSEHHYILVSLSGGSDSDIMLDFILRVARENGYDDDIFKFVFFDTGLEYKATKRHLDELEEKYKIKIERIKSTKPIPLACKEYGVPFISKFISQMIERLQKKNFDFKNDGWKSLKELNKKYPKTLGALSWWCNAYETKNGKKSQFNIDNTKYLKEFIIENPPDFKISAKCCDEAKKKPSHDYEKTHAVDMKCLGLRQMEGGIRSSAIHSCFTDNTTYIDNPPPTRKSYDEYRPIWWFTDKDKEEYKKMFNITFSDCYEKWGFTRTGCANCPFNSKFEEEMKIVEKWEPLMVKATNNIFGKSYEYIRKYREYRAKRVAENKENRKYGILKKDKEKRDRKENGEQ